ncbi:hypothetical protein IQ06DRAFT_378573 [Phaeosphaeriaceae sp. SRC1lsM3a]|nr:hypothetical protein IQ06DRAFT_378573 [Stagonospora sp. SRC1lsM3a]
MLLQFVNDTAIGPEERRLIRSHVMRGKNAGRPRPPRKPLVHRKEELSISRSDDKRQEVGEIKHILYPHQPLWNELSLTSYPYYIGPEKERFVYQRLWIIAKALYPPEFCTEVNLSHYAWFRFVLEDVAYFHCLLAICFSFTTHFGGPRRISSEALRHISQAYRMTNERLSSFEACSDQAIAVVTMLAIYQRMHHQQAVGLVHFQGLRRMVELRGGLAKLASENRALAQKPWRLALEFALQDGAPATFSLGDVYGSHHSTGFKSFNNASDEQNQELMHRRMTRSVLPTCTVDVDPTLLQLLTSINDFTNFLNSTTDKTKLDPLDYSDAVCFLLHRLLAYAPISPLHRHHLPQLDNLIHLTLVTVMTTLLPEYGHNQARYDLLTNQLRETLQTMRAPETAKEQAVLLWAVFVAYVTILDDMEDEAMLNRMAVENSETLKLHYWDDLKRLLCSFGWIGVLYDKAGSRLLQGHKARCKT